MLFHMNRPNIDTLFHIPEVPIWIESLLSYRDATEEKQVRSFT